MPIFWPKYRKVKISQGQSENYELLALKPHFFTKTGQKLVFSRKKRMEQNYGTCKKCETSFIKKVKLEKKNETV